MAPMLVRSAISVFFEYDTPRIVHIKSKKVGFFNRFLQACIIAYVIGYAIVMQKGYQDFDNVQSAVTTKLKGVAYTNHSDLPGIGSRIWDVADYVVPPQENNAFFVMTNMIITPDQVQSTCAEDYKVTGAICMNDTDCDAGHPLPGGNGVMNGSCISVNETLKVCAIHAWCPVEKDEKPAVPLLLASQNFTVFIKNNIEFPKFNIKRRNLLEFMNDTYLKTCRYDPSDPDYQYCPMFRLGNIIDILHGDYTRIARQGAVIQILIHWDCNLDYDENNCVPEYEFRRLDSDDYVVSKGFNFRYAQHYKDNNVTKRTLIKAYGIRFIVTVQGRAGKFNVVPLMLNIGSGLALLSIATIVCDIFVLYILKARTYFRDKKYLTVTGDDAYQILDEGRQESPIHSRALPSSTNLSTDD